MMMKVEGTMNELPRVRALHKFTCNGEHVRFGEPWQQLNVPS